ncbi:SYT9 [Lemmus lemmus]
MPGARDALCHQALQLLAELCAQGALKHDSCQDFIYHLRDRARPRLRDPGKRRRPARPEGPGMGTWGRARRATPTGGEQGVTNEPKELSKSSAPWPDARTGRRLL